MKKKILLAIGQLAGGGAERVVSVWANQLNKHGYDVSILLYSRSANEYYVEPEVKIYSVRQSRSEYLQLPLYERYRNIRNILKKVSPKYIISFLPKMQIWISLASLGLQTKRIETIRINPWQIKGLGLFRDFLWHQCYNSSYKIILQATEQKDFFSRKNQKKCVLIPNPICPLYDKNFKKVITDKISEFIAVGRIDPQKNYPLMIKAFAYACRAYPYIRLRIYGTGNESYIKRINTLIISLGMQNNIQVMGQTSHIEEEYKKSDVFLMTSDFEGLPNALMEAMASSLVCISTDCRTGPKDLIDNGVSGFLIPVGDETKLAATIVKAINMTVSEREAMGNFARKHILDYCSEGNSVKKLMEILD